MALIICFKTSLLKPALPLEKMGAHGVNMPKYNLKNALEFNKYTCTINIALVPYAILMIKNHPNAPEKLIFSIVFVYLMMALLYGMLVFGRSAKVKDDALDEILRDYALTHLGFLVPATVVLGIHAFFAAWKGVVP